MTAFVTGLLVSRSMNKEDSFTEAPDAASYRLTNPDWKLLADPLACRRAAFPSRTLSVGGSRSASLLGQRV